MRLRILLKREFLFFIVKVVFFDFFFPRAFEPRQVIFYGYGRRLTRKRILPRTLPVLTRENTENFEAYNAGSRLTGSGVFTR